MTNRSETAFIPLDFLVSDLEPMSTTRSSTRLTVDNQYALCMNVVYRLKTEGYVLRRN